MHLMMNFCELSCLFIPFFVIYWTHSPCEFGPVARNWASGAEDGHGSGTVGALLGMAGVDRSRSRRHTLTEFQPNLESIREKFLRKVVVTQWSVKRKSLQMTLRCGDFILEPPYRNLSHTRSAIHVCV